MKLRVQSVDDLINIASKGTKVFSRNTFMDPAILASRVVRISAYGLDLMIEKGIFYEGEERELAPLGGILQETQDKVRATGLSQIAIAERVGVIQQRTNEFMTCSNCRVSTLQKYLDIVK